MVVESINCGSQCGGDGGRRAGVVVGGVFIWGGRGRWTGSSCGGATRSSSTGASSRSPRAARLPHAAHPRTQRTCRSTGPGPRHGPVRVRTAPLIWRGLVLFLETAAANAISARHHPHAHERAEVLLAPHNMAHARCAHVHSSHHTPQRTLNTHITTKTQNEVHIPSGKTTQHSTQHARV